MKSECISSVPRGIRVEPRSHEEQEGIPLHVHTRIAMQ
jgi:hypothetical protein